MNVLALPRSSMTLRSLSRPVLSRPVLSTPLARSAAPTAPAAPAAPAASGPPAKAAPADERVGRAHAAVELYELAVEGLAAAAGAPRSDHRYAAANLAALRAAAAVVAVHAASGSGRATGGRAANVWKLLAGHSPELREWADFFAAATARRAALNAGTASISTREADDLLRDAVAFVELVGTALGLEIERLSGLGECLAVIHAPE